nr:hypothetical protein [Paenibacillus xylanexedens]
MIVDIKRRTTKDWELYKKYIKSIESYIYLDKETSDSGLKEGETASLDFTVGKRWFNLNDSRWYTIPKEGVILKSNEGATFETYEHLALPMNIFGVVTGVGRHIYRGGMISPGKIDPGFSGRLRIGFYNSSKSKKIIKPGDTLCSCYFLHMEETISTQLTRNAPEPETSTVYNKRRLLFNSFIRTSWQSIIPMLIAAISLIITVYINFFK